MVQTGIGPLLSTRDCKLERLCGGEDWGPHPRKGCLHWVPRGSRRELKKGKATQTDEQHGKGTAREGTWYSRNWTVVSAAGILRARRLRHEMRAGGTLWALTGELRAAGSHGKGSSWLASGSEQ